jgi:hypothetical protein
MVRKAGRRGRTGGGSCGPQGWPGRARRRSARPARPARAPHRRPRRPRPTPEARIKSVGITQLGLPWLLGGYEYGGAINQIFHGFIGDVRIVRRALRVEEFMIAR